MADDNDVSRTRSGEPGEVFTGDRADGEAELGPEELDALFELMADRQRREVLSYLAAGDEEADVEEIAARVDDRLPEPSSPHRTAVRLHHVTLPRIAATGLITYDSDSGRVRCHRQRLLREFLAVLDEDQ